MSAHVDSFARDHLPPRELWPEMDYGGLPELRARDTINCAEELLDRNVTAGHGGRTAFVFPGGRWTYAETLDVVNRLARVLVEDCGLVPGSRVLLRGYNSPMMAALWLAVLKAGGICVATMPLLRARELSYIINKAQVRLALCDARLAEECRNAQQTTTFLKRIDYFGGDGADTLDARMRGKSSDFTAVPTAADETAIIAFTSGTTGQAKGTMHFHRDILACCDTFSRLVLEPAPDDLFCGSPPLAFTYGLGGLLLFPLRAGASALLLEQATPPHLLKGIQDFRATVCFTAPTAYRAMLGPLSQHDVSSLRKCVSAGETLPKATFEAWLKATGVKIIDGIGSTEMLHIFIGAAGDEIRAGATGKAVRGYRARVVDERGDEVPPGTIGLLAVRGPTGCRYLDNLERQRAYVHDGWNYPGDSYRMDEDGYFWYQSRTDDMIVSAGYNISAEEVEQVILEHSAVLECGVVAAPDEERGHIVKAYVVLRPGFEAGPARVKEIQEHVKAVIAPYKYPRAVEFVDVLPRTGTGKLQRYRLREKGA